MRKRRLKRINKLSKVAHLPSGAAWLYMQFLCLQRLRWSCVQFPSKNELMHFKVFPIGYHRQKLDKAIGERNFCSLINKCFILSMYLLKLALFLSVLCLFIFRNYTKNYRHSEYMVFIIEAWWHTTNCTSLKWSKK